MVEALRAKGIPVAYIAFEGEQHGFRQAQNIKRALDGELYFYSRVFGFELADDVEPVEIENLVIRSRRQKQSAGVDGRSKELSAGAEVSCRLLLPSAPIKELGYPQSSLRRRHDQPRAARRYCR